MTVRVRSIFLIVLTMLGIGMASVSPVRAADDGEGTTLEGIVNDVIIGHAEDGPYLSVGPKSIELPRIMLARTADGSLTLDVYGSTKALLTSGPYGLVPHGEGEGHEDLVTGSAQLEEAIANKEHLHSSVARTQGHIVVDLSITRHLIFGLLAMAIVLGVFIPLAQRYKRGVGRKKAPQGVLQNMMEVLVVFVRDEIAKPNIGEEKYRTFLPYLLSAFFFILVANILGLVPLAGAATSNIAVTGVLAVMTFVIGLLYGSKEHYRELLTGPPDAPILIRIILVPIEIIGHVMRHLALAIRLFANMMGGALIIFSLLGLVFIMNTLFGPALAWGSSVVSIVFTVFILLLKLLVAFIQAYVFTILSALFIGMAVEEHHDEEHSPMEEERHEGHPDGAAVPATDSVDERLEAVEETAQPTPA